MSSIHRVSVADLTTDELREVRQRQRMTLCRYGIWLDDEQTDFDYGQSTHDTYLASGRQVRQYISQWEKAR